MEMHSGAVLQHAFSYPLVDHSWIVIKVTPQKVIYCNCSKVSEIIPNLILNISDS